MGTNEKHHQVMIAGGGWNDFIPLVMRSPSSGWISPTSMKVIFYDNEGSDIGFRCVFKGNPMSRRVIRGGGWYNDGSHSLGSAYRARDGTASREDILGFRCVFKKEDKDEMAI